MAPFPELLRAAADGDLEQLKFLLASGVSPSVSNNIGQTGLHLAAMWGHDEACEALLAAKADVNVQNDWGVTPLHYAAQNSKYEVASLLLLNGAKPNLKAKNGTSPYESAKEDEMRDLCGGPKLEVHRAIKANDVKGVLKLVSEGADLSEVDNSERTALYLAVAAAVSESASVRERVGAMAMVGALLKAAQETSSAGQLAIAMCQRADDGMTPFHLAARVRHLLTHSLTHSLTC
jgi:ankyrin repeat protein